MKIKEAHYNKKIKVVHENYCGGPQRDEALSSKR